MARRTATAASRNETVGARLARIRKERGITQVELGEKLGLAQPHVSAYERDEVRLNGPVIIQLAEILGVSSDEILGLARPKNGTAPQNRRLLRRVQEIERLPKRDQQALLRTIDAFLNKAG